MSNVVHIEANMPWVYTVHRETGHWIGVCEPLKLTVTADNPQEFYESIREGMNSFFKELVSTGDFHHFLRDHGRRAEQLGDTDVNAMRLYLISQTTNRAYDTYD